MRNQIRSVIGKALATLGIECEKEIEIEVPKDRANGDYSSNVALQLVCGGGSSGTSARWLADEIIRQMDFGGTGIRNAQCAGLGFINFYLEEKCFSSLLPNTVGYGLVKNIVADALMGVQHVEDLEPDVVHFFALYRGAAKGVIDVTAASAQNRDNLYFKVIYAYAAVCRLLPPEDEGSGTDRELRRCLADFPEVVLRVKQTGRVSLLIRYWLGLAQRDFQGLSHEVLSAVKAVMEELSELTGIQVFEKI